MHKGSLNETHVHEVQTNIHKLDYSRKAIWRHDTYKHMQGTKPKHAKGQVTFNVNNLTTSYCKEAHWI